MKQTILNEHIPTLLQKQQGTCVSIIAPVHRTFSERRTDREHLNKAIQRAKEYLQANYPEEEIKPLTKALDELYQQVEFNHNEEGIGLFAAAGIQQIMQYFLPVKEKVVINESFEIRDLLYQDYYSGTYIVLMLSEKEARLFQAEKNTLKEIHNTGFPKKHDAQYEYNRPIYGSANGKNAFIKTTERDKSQMEEIRYEGFLKQVDKELNTYLTRTTPLVLTGAKKDLAGFKKVTRHAPNIAGQVVGNHSHLSSNELGGLTWNILMSYLNVSKQKEIRDLAEKSGEGNCIIGIRNIWKAVQEGRGFKLLIEKDFTNPGFLRKNNDFQLYLRPPKGEHRTLPDAVNSLIQVMLEKNGEVILVENNELTDYQRMALVTRY